MKFSKLFVVCTFAVLMSVLFSLPALAVTNVGTPESRAISHHERDLLQSSINGYEALSGDYLINVWHSEINDVGSGQVELYGYTQCNRSCDTVSVKLVLQKWTGSTWQSLSSYTFTNNYSSYVSGTKTVSVERGKYYRVWSYHYAEDGTLTDQCTATSDSIYVQ